MNLPKSALEALLPCYLCGDLPPDIAAQVDAALQADPALQARLQVMGRGREACIAALHAVAGEIPEVGALLTRVQGAAPSPAQPGPAQPSHGAPGGAPEGAPWMGLLAALAAAALLLATWTGAPAAPEEIALLAVHRSAVAQGPAFINAEESAALSRAFTAAGVLPSHAMAPDLSAQGYHLLGGMVSADHNGVAVVYEKDGKRFVCQIYGATVTRSRPDKVQVVRGVTLRGFQHKDGAVVAWTAGTRTCLFSGDAPLDTLLAEAAARLGPSQG